MIERSALTPYNCAYSLAWSYPHKAWCATCLEFPLLECIEPAPMAALDGIRALVATAIEDMNWEPVTVEIES